MPLLQFPPWPGGNLVRGGRFSTRLERGLSDLKALHKDKRRFIAERTTAALAAKKASGVRLGISEKHPGGRAAV
jgi:hypothetical protein